MHDAALENSPAKLVLLAITPGVDEPIGGKSHDVVSATSYVNDLDRCECRQLGRVELELGVLVEAQDALV